MRLRWIYRGNPNSRHDLHARREVYDCIDMDEPGRVIHSVFEQYANSDAPVPHICEFRIYASKDGAQPVQFDSVAAAQFYCDGIKRDEYGEPIENDDRPPPEPFNKWGRF